MSFKSILILISLTIWTSVSTAQMKINGAGSSLAVPIFNKWAKTYYNSTNNKVNYTATGSSAGIRQLEQETIDFAGTDIKLTESELNKSGLIQFPMVSGGIVPVINLPNVRTLVLDTITLANIFEGKIDKWNNPEIKKLNPDVILPDIKIIKVVRADGSGTTEVFTKFLSKVSQSFEQKIGFGKFVSWSGPSAAGKGNTGVSAFMQRLRGTIGYVGYEYAINGNLTIVDIIDKNGNVLRANPALFLESTDETYQYWPIVATTYLVVHKKNISNVRPFVEWVLTFGDSSALELMYNPMSNEVKENIRKDIRRELNKKT